MQRTAWERIARCGIVGIVEEGFEAMGRGFETAVGPQMHKFKFAFGFDGECLDHIPSLKVCLKDLFFQVCHMFRGLSSWAAVVYTYPKRRKYDN